MTPRHKKAAASEDPRSRLVSVAVLIEQDAIKEMIVEHSRLITLDAVRTVLDRERKKLAEEAEVPSVEQVVDLVREELAFEALDRLRPVVNAAGVVLHTGLGRAVLPKKAVAALAGLDRCVNLQIDLESGRRGKRNYMTEHLLCRLTGAEAAMVVSNNAAATLLILTAMASGREVIISRGQLIEIGGSFRLPDCISQSGARMVEVGTTNKTHLRDYENAMTEDTAVVLRCNPSNYRIVGFSKSVPTADLVTLKKEWPDLVVVDDLGCGALIDISRYGLPKEPMVPESIAAGADLVCFSGDKLIGGPQAGIIVGRKDLIAKIKKHPLTRMLRVGKLTDLALEHTLRLFLDPDSLPETNPTYTMLAAKPVDLKRKAMRMMRLLEKATPGLEVELVETVSATGGGSLPATPIPTWVVAVRSPNRSANALSRLLRKSEPPVVARIEEDRIFIDTRTLLDGEDRIVVQALVAIEA